MGSPSNAAPGLTAASMLVAYPRRSVGRRLLLDVVFLAGLWVLAVAVAGLARAANGDSAGHAASVLTDKLVTAANGVVHTVSKDGVLTTTSSDDGAVPGTD